MIPNKVKLIVWDLDETFWQGTLSEEGIVAIDRNIEMVRELSKRGIVNSICSKNDFEQAKGKLVELEIWEHFVFPSIGFNPKGKAVAEMIEGAALRPENVLFLDDNRLNLEEVKFFNKGIMAAHPADVLDGLLEHAHLAGKPDPELTRLKQYQVLQRKVEERGVSDLSNEEFLRASNIRVMIDHDVEGNIDRVIDLINRANQLNYTKKRLETPQDVAAFRESLNAFGRQAGCVHAVDQYGDYGLIGFFLQRRRFHTNKLVHFVFSCRTMNMGIEQYVYELLGRPDIDIVEPVSYGLNSHAAVDWIADANNASAENGSPGDQKLVLVGGCDLLQLASYCSTRRTEFVNAQRDGVILRYDDPGFILSDRTAIRNSESLCEISSWTYEDAARFDQAIAEAELTIISMWAAINAQYFRSADGVTLSLKKDRAAALASVPLFAREFEPLELDDDGKMDLIFAAFDRIAACSAPQSRVFVLGSYTLGPRSEQKKRRERFNDRCRRYCEQHGDRFRFVDLDATMPAEALVGNQHFSRMGYFALARHILQRAAVGHTTPETAEP
jgi:FkbH-like protein